jgi:membrane protein DedA with SNARE-associated domain
MEWQNTLEHFLNWISLQDGFVIWIFFFFSNLLENVFPPWPGDTVTVFGGFLVANEDGLNPTSFGIMALASSTFFGNLAGAYLMLRFGHRFLNFIRRNKFPGTSSLIDDESIHRTFGWFKRNAILVVLISRFSAGIRFFVAIVAGMVGMNRYLFFSLFSIAVTLWCGLLIGGGYMLGSNWETVLEILNVYNRVILVLISISVLFFLFYQFIYKRFLTQ